MKTTYIFYSSAFIVVLITVVFIAWQQQNIVTSPTLNNETTTLIQQNVVTTITLNNEPETVQTINKEPEVTIKFIDPVSYCLPNGWVFINGNLINKTFLGVVNVSESLLSSSIKEGVIYILFTLNESNCRKVESRFFNYPPDLLVLFVLDLNESYNLTKDKLELTFNISTYDPTIPRYTIDYLNLIRPDDVRWYLEELRPYFKNSTYEDLELITKRLQVSVRASFTMETKYYWKLPNQTLKDGYGDCKHFSTVLLSLFKAYNSSFKCYNLRIPTHLTTFCKLYVEEGYPTFVFYDQGETMVKENFYLAYTEEQKCNRIKSLLENFFSQYGLEPSRQHVFSAFDNNDFYEFADDDEFCKWAIEI
jgi:hypothetical protein